MFTFIFELGYAQIYIRIMVLVFLPSVLLYGYPFLYLKHDSNLLRSSGPYSMYNVTVLFTENRLVALIMLTIPAPMTTTTDTCRHWRWWNPMVKCSGRPLWNSGARVTLTLHTSHLMTRSVNWRWGPGPMMDSR